MADDRDARTVRPVERVSLVDSVTREIKQAVLDGTLRPGAEFSIRELSRRLGVSHIPVREALRNLEAQGLIERRYSRSVMVVPLSADEVDEVYRLRALLESDVVARAVRKYTPEQIEELRQALAAVAALPAGSEARMAAHHEFHLRLLEPGMSAWDLRLLETLWSVSERYNRLVHAAITGSGTDEDVFLRAHQPLIDAAASGKAREMRAAMTAHLEVNRAAILEALRDHELV